MAFVLPHLFLFQFFLCFSVQEVTNALQNEEDKANRLSKLKIKLESTVQEGHDDLQKEKQIRGEVEKAKRKLEGDLKVHTQLINESFQQGQKLL